MARKRFVWGKWREVREDGVIGPVSPTPAAADQELFETQVRLAQLELVPLVLKGG